MLYVMTRADLIVTPYNGYEDFLDTLDEKQKTMTDEQLGQLTSYGHNDTYRIVTKKFYDTCEKLQEESTT